MKRRLFHFTWIWVFGFIVGLLFWLAFPLLWGEYFLGESVNGFQFVSMGCIYQTMTLNKWFAGELFGYQNDAEFIPTSVWFINYFLQFNNEKNIGLFFLSDFAIRFTVLKRFRMKSKHVFCIFYKFIHLKLEILLFLIFIRNLCDFRSLFICWFKFNCDTCQLPIIKIYEKCHKMNATVGRNQ